MGVVTDNPETLSKFTFVILCDCADEVGVTSRCPFLSQRERGSTIKKETLIRLHTWPFQAEKICQHASTTCWSFDQSQLYRTHCRRMKMSSSTLTDHNLGPAGVVRDVWTVEKIIWKIVISYVHYHSLHSHPFQKNDIEELKYARRP